ncbi:laminin subunit alpha-2-like isoform X6 [Aphelenchoides avenae]|nr:laminin subunit alpha-2-like isoform X6 [Aphelenchus avenae]
MVAVKRHNTTGPRCEQCLPGFYGNPSLGVELGACQPCACPTIERSRSATCALSQLVFESVAAAEQDEYVCTACEEGYEGNKCEVCADGYFGDPLAVNGTCEPCTCNGNIDSMAIGNCDSVTGECLRCIGHTTGEHCERCEDNHWGSALEHTCRACNCHRRGSVSLQCHNDTGRCDCNENYTGAHCDRCLAGHGGIEDGCPKCACNATGSLGTSCDEISGQCSCKKGVFGKNCDMCITSYFGFGEHGCEYCHCNEFGAIEGKECHNITGECQCRPRVEGTRCERCEPGFFNLTSGQGCQPCECNEVGSVGTECNVDSGQCVCKPGVTGLKCDKCAPNYYGLDAEGCKQCQRCPAPGHVCDAITGECVCPPNTVGEMCEACTPNAWSYHPLKGCELCDCSGIGADSSQCNSRTGQCKCKSGYVGHKCDHCEPGFFNFPDCEPCNCDVSGTDPLTCKGDTCICENNGQCKCKKHVTGDKCDQCAANSFSLETQNPLGCTECFCFNRTAECEQSDLFWKQIYTADRTVTFETPFEYFTRRHNIHILREEPQNYNSYLTNHAPLYWPLPRSFLGDRTGSYNGFIRFRISNDDNYRKFSNVLPEPSRFRVFPQVVLVGNHRIELEHVPVDVAHDGKYKVRLHETQWRNRISPQLPVSRKQFMVALQNVQAVYIRGTYSDMYRGDSIALREVSLDVAAGAAEVGSSGSPAVGVEQCLTCPEGYTGSSCQNPAEGYCRKRIHDYLNNPDDLTLVGYASPCDCHGHSTICDPETCRCTDCAHNTVGDFCELCRPGYYGNAREGHADSCHKCACPLATNSFSDTCTVSETGRGYVCDACKPGYTGPYCESCIPGYFGNPTVEGGFCDLCACHPYGSLHGICNNVTGSCECREGVEGRDCSLCRPRDAFINRVCTSCDQGCYKELMIFEDEMEEQLSSIENIHDIKPIPASAFDELLSNVKSSNTEAKSLVSDLGTENRHTKLANIVDQEFRLITERTNDSLTRIKELEATLARIRDTYWSQNRKVVETSRHLGDFTDGVGSRHSQSQVDSLVLQAERYLEALRERDEALEKKYNYARKNADDAEQLLKAILAKKINDTSYDELFKTTQAHREMIKAFRDTIWDVARENTMKARDLTTATKARIASLERLIAQIGQYETDAKEQLAQAEKNVEDIRAHVLNIQDDYKEVDDRVLPELRELREQIVEDHINYYRDTLHEYHNSYVRKAEQHAKDLEHLAHRLKSRFSAAHSMSTDALAASTAYHEIAGALRNASVAAKKAKQNAEDAFAVVDPSSETSLVTEAGLALNKSLALKQLALDHREGKYEAQADELHKSIEKIKLQSEDIEKNITWIKDVQQLLDDHHDRINTVYSTADDSAEVVATIGSSTKDLFDEVDALKKQADSVTNFNEKAILDDIANVTKASDDIERIKRIVEDVRERSKRQNEQIAEIRHDMSVLKEKIKEAREKASKVKVGVKSEVGSACVREYLSPLSLSATNSITLKYRPALESPDSLIFLTTTKGTRTQGREYIAVELKSKKIHVHWDIGAGRRDAAVIKRNLVYIPLSDRFTWYQIEINRIGNTMKITLSQKRVLSSEGARDVDEPIHVTVGEPDVTNNVIFNTEPGHTRVYVGHTDARLTEELGLATNHFHGTLGEMVIDGSSVPLWTFDSTSGNCDGAVGPPSPRVTGHMLRNGFAQVRLPMNERANTMITVTFSAYSPNGLLYFRGSRSTGNFVAIELQDGSVVVKMHFGGESHVEVRSGKDTYADGHVYKVRTIRSHDEVHLQIDPEDRVSTVVPGESPVLNIDEADHYVGGVPPDYNTTAFAAHDIKFLGFFGCIQSVRPNQVSELDLDHPVRSQRMEPGCEFREERLAPADRVIGFTQPGYLVTRGIRLSTDSTLSFNVRTKSSNALLLYQSGKVHKRTIRDTSGDDFIAVVIYGGRIIVQLGTSDQRMKRPSLSSNNSYNDGLLHSIFLSRIGSDIQVRIDDREVLAATLDDERTIGTEDASLIFGGFPEKYRFENQNNDLSTTEPLIGCLTDLYHNYEYDVRLFVAMLRPVFRKLPLIPEEHQANMGSCQFDELVAPEAEEPLTEEEQRQFDRKNSKISLMLAAPTLSSSHLASSLDTPWQTCEASGAGYSNDTVREQGVRFGVSESSHARVNFAKPYPDYSNFTVSFSFRTRQRKSMLWTWSNYKNYTRYFYLNVEGGFLTLEAKGHKEPKTMQFKGKRVDDNEWHTVVLTKRGREASVQVDDLESEIMKDAPNPKVMRKRMYVGGVISKHRKQFDLPLPGFSGCIRNFQVDGAVQDLLAASRDVLPCARNRNVAYVHDGGYALFGPLREYKREESAKPAEIGFSFRSTHPESALLMAMLYATEDAYQNARFVVHLRNSSLVITAHFSKHRLTFEHALKTSACPQQWHHFSMVIGAKMVSVTMDGTKDEFPVEIPRAAMEEIHSLPIHVGGTTAPVSVSLETKSLAGCVKNLQLSGVLVPFSKAKKTHKVLQNGCPFS